MGCFPGSWSPVLTREVAYPIIFPATVGQRVLSSKDTLWSHWPLDNAMWNYGIPPLLIVPKVPKSGSSLSHHWLLLWVDTIIRNLCLLYFLFKILAFIIFNFVCVRVCARACAHVHAYDFKCLERPDMLELELQVVANCLIWAPEINCGSSARVVITLSPRAITLIFCASFDAECIPRVHVLKIWSPKRYYGDVGETPGSDPIW